MPPAAHHYSGRFVAENLLTKKIVRKSVQKRVGVDLDPRTAAKQAAHKRKSCIMNNPENLTYSIDKTRLRMGAAVGVLVIAAGLALGSVMHTSSSSANEPTSSVIDNNTAGEEAPDTGNGSNQTSDTASINVGNEQPAADKGSVNDETVELSQDSNETDTSEAEETNATEADETEEAEVDEIDETEVEEADDTEEADDDEGNGLGFDFELVYPVIPDWFMNPLPLPDDLGPPAPDDPIIPPNPLDPRIQRYAGLLGRIS